MWRLAEMYTMHDSCTSLAKAANVVDQAWFRVDPTPQVLARELAGLQGQRRRRRRREEREMCIYVDIHTHTSLSICYR